MHIYAGQGWGNETAAPPPAVSSPVPQQHATDAGCHCPNVELKAGLCACLKLEGYALTNISNWMWLPNLFILNSAGGAQRPESDLEQTLMISHACVLVFG